MKAHYIVVEDCGDRPLIIRDAGPWTLHPTVTNDAERVVEDLVKQGRLPDGRRLFCYDSDGNLDELLVNDGKFSGFQFIGSARGSLW